MARITYSTRTKKELVDRMHKLPMELLRDVAAGSLTLEEAELRHQVRKDNRKAKRFDPKKDVAGYVDEMRSFGMWDGS